MEQHGVEVELKIALALLARTDVPIERVADHLTAFVKQLRLLSRELRDDTACKA